jgi:hypothetical protein
LDAEILCTLVFNPNILLGKMGMVRSR